MRKYISVFILSTILLLGCEDSVDIQQPGRLLGENAYNSVENIELGILGLYDDWDNTPQIQFNSVFTDEVKIGPENGGQGINNGEYGFRLNSASAIAQAVWANQYRMINIATRIIEAGALLDVTGDELDRLNEALGIARTIRAYAYFTLLTYYSPDLTNDASEGVIILEEIPTDITISLPKSTTGEVFTVIEADIAMAETLVTEQSNATFVSLDFITALKARMAAYRGNYTDADTHAEALLQNYDIADAASYPGVFTDDNNSGIIFKLERTINDTYDGQGSTGSGFAGGWAGANYAFVNATITGTPYFTMSTSLFDLLNSSDVRYDVLVEPTADFANNIIPVGKYRGSEGQNLMNDLKIFRAAEMLLIRAEAAADANNLADAADFVDQLRDARFGTDQTAPVYANQAEAFADILFERRLEFAYEGFRWVDMKRLGTKAGISGIVRAAADCAINGACTLDITDIRMQALPIPLSELNGNSVIQQTTGY